MKQPVAPREAAGEDHRSRPRGNATPVDRQLSSTLVTRMVNVRLSSRTG